MKVYEFDAASGVKAVYEVHVNAATTIGDIRRLRAGKTEMALKADGEWVMDADDTPFSLHYYKRVWLCYRFVATMEVLLNRLTGAVDKIPCSPTYSVDQLPVVIEKALGIPIKQQRLIFAGQRILDTPWKTLQDYAIKDSATMHLILNLRGGGGEAITAKTFSVMEDYKVQAFSESAPAWRAASPGLCLETKCRNEKCPAYESYVILNKGLHPTGYDVLNASSLWCPSCDLPVDITGGDTTCAFNNCQWRMAGLEANGNVRQTDWQLVGNKYQRFEGQDTKTARRQTAWSKLLLFTRPATALLAVCCWCDNSKSDLVKWSCGHYSHQKCKGKAGEACPICLHLATPLPPQPVPGKMSADEFEDLLGKVYDGDAEARVFCATTVAQRCIRTGNQGGITLGRVLALVGGDTGNLFVIDIARAVTLYSALNL